jgi:Mg-chelatase subunit ChlD
MRLSALAAMACLLLTANTAFGQGNFRIQRAPSDDPVASVSDDFNGPGPSSVNSFKLTPSQTQSTTSSGWANEFAEPETVKQVLDAAAFANRMLQAVRSRPAPPSFARVHENMTRPINGMQLAPTEVARLRGKHVTIIMDRSGSMKTEDCAMPMSLGAFSPRSMSRWDWCLNQTVDLARQTAQVLPQGLTLVFFSSSDSVYHNVQSDKIPNLFARNSPDGGTNLVGALKHRLDDYFRAQSMGNTQPLVLAVVTDGDPDSPRALKELIVETTHRMTSPDQISITFLQVGNDSKGGNLLDQLDHSLTMDGAGYDIVSVTPFRQVLSRGLAKSLVLAVQNPPVARRF